MSSRISADRNAIRSVASVRVRCASPSRASAAVCSAARPSPTSTGSPRTSSATWAAIRSSARAESAVADCVYLPTSTMNSGTSGRVIATSPADSRSVQARASSTTGGTTRVCASAGR